MREGGGTSRPSEKPIRTAISQRIARPTGSASPSAGRAKRASDGRSPVRAAGSATVMEKRDMGRTQIATRKPQPLVPAKAGTQGQELDARFRGHERRYRRLIRHRHPAIVDQVL